ncbi:MAG TPA: phosphoribosyltransferase family protein [Candidatus Paceibacterota bacterium]
MALFADRHAAGQQLAGVLRELVQKRALVLALPRGGVPVGSEIARAFKVPLDTLVARKVGSPFNPEFAVGALAPHDVLVLDKHAMRQSGSSDVAIQGVVASEREEMRRRMSTYRSGSYSVGYVPEIVIVVDDGIATGMTALAALRAARVRYRRARLILASPVCLVSTAALKKDADDVVCLARPKDLHAIGQAYEQFEQVNDTEVIALLDGAARALKNGTMST